MIRFLCSVILFLPAFSTATGQELIPYLQQKASYVNQVHVTGQETGWAAASGAGFETAGGFYRYSNGRWVVTMAFPYSDAPLLKVFNEKSVYGLHHETHFGHWRYQLFRYNGNQWDRQDIPLKKWDATDYVILWAMDGLSEQDLWLVGQKATVLRRLNGNWVSVRSPVVWNEGEDDFAKDFLSLVVAKDGTAWVGGKNGIFIRFSGSVGVIQKLTFQSSIHPLTEGPDGWIYGGTDAGDLFKTDGQTVKILKSPVTGSRIQQIRFTPEKNLLVLQDDRIFQSADGDLWQMVLDLKAFEFTATTFDLVPDADGQMKLMVGTTGGLYGTGIRGSVSFRDGTAESNINSRAKGGFFFHANDDMAPDLYLTGEIGQPDLLMINNGTGQFNDQTLQAGLLTSSNGSIAGTAADIDGDGDEDLAVIRHEDHSIKIFRNRGNERFDDITDWCGLGSVSFRKSAHHWGNTLHFLDLNLDGAPELLSTSWEYGIRLFRNNGIGRFSEPDTTAFSHLNSHPDHRFTGLASWFNHTRNCWEIGILSDNAGFFHYQFFPQSESLQLIQSYPAIKGMALTATILPGETNPVLFAPDRSKPNRIFRFQGDSLTIDTIPMEFSSDPVWPGFPSSYIKISDMNADGFPDILFGTHLLLWDGDRYVDTKLNNGLSAEGTSTLADADSDGDTDILIVRGSDFGSVSAFYFQNLIKSSVRTTIRPIRQWGNWSDLRFYLKSDTIQYLGGTRFGQSGSTGQSALPFFIPESSSTVFFKSINDSGLVNGTGSISFPTETIISRLPELIISGLNNYRLYASWIEEFLKLIFTVGLIVLILRTLRNTELNRLIRHPLYWGSAIFIYLVLFLITAQDPVSIHLIIPLAGSWISWAGAVSLVYAYRIYLKTNYIGPYRIEKYLGEGASGRVYLARNPTEKRLVALKLFHERAFDTREGLIRFQREVAAGMTLDHAGIVRIYGQGDFGKQRYLVMEYVDGVNLREYLTRDVSTLQVVDWLIYLCDAIDYMHRNGMLHRDIKTENIMVETNGTLKIMDLGLAKATVFATMTRLGTSVGTLAYMSPQQAVGMQLDATSDIYSLGVVGYELLTGGTLPVTGDNDISFVYNIFNQIPVPASTYNSSVSQELDAIILRCIAKQPGDRYLSASDLSAELRQLLPKNGDQAS